MCPFNKTDKQSCISQQFSFLGFPVASRGILMLKSHLFTYSSEEMWWLFKWLVSVSSFYSTNCLLFRQKKSSGKWRTDSFTLASHGTSKPITDWTPKHSFLCLQYVLLGSAELSGNISVLECPKKEEKQNLPVAHLPKKELLVATVSFPETLNPEVFKDSVAI